MRADLRAAMQRLEGFSYLGHTRKDVTEEPIHFWCVYYYLIAYHPKEKPLQVLHVLHGGQDLGRFFKSKHATAPMHVRIVKPCSPAFREHRLTLKL